MRLPESWVYTGFVEPAGKRAVTVEAEGRVLATGQVDERGWFQLEVWEYFEGRSHVNVEGEVTNGFVIVAPPTYIPRACRRKS